ncbi:hypothetical protein Egran_00879 [Elaphomyces granulatus]|uniref:Spo7-like protein n=1 Tax=Elaphomyces granulatus TaxID=519963 RepID=A0A232M4T6_9EURO|nr:hypothetical protein Egran_00879 [Elaphomyces granulatus]
MASSRLDQLVKGAPVSDAKDLVPEPPVPLPRSYLQPSAAPSTTTPSRPSTPDPLSTIPSSPPQIYLNLLILESSLRAQYLALRERRRQNTFFLLLLAIWIAYFSYALFLRPREDGRGVGGSVYWVVETGEKVALMGGLVTGILTWGTGQWERGVRWPRRWLAVANRGLRAINTKVVVIQGSWWRELLSYLSFIFPYSSLFQSPGNYHYVELTPAEKRAHQQHHTSFDSDSEAGFIEEDLAPGGDYIRLLLLPKAFSPEFRENWDEYRTDYWEKENERRTQLRHKLQERDRQLARQDGGWFRWFGWRSSKQRRVIPEKSQHHHSTSSSKIHDPRPRRGTISSPQAHHHSRASSRTNIPLDMTNQSMTEQGQQRRKKNSRSLGARSLSPLAPALVRESTASISSDDSSSVGGEKSMESQK